MRVCFLVSRHTTYLKYCIRDVAAAFEARGMKTRIITEPSDFTDIPAAGFMETIRSFRPDLFFVIDHFRHEYPEIIPKNLPYVGWVQDQMPHLYSRKCGQSLGPLDFFITPSGLGALGACGYPARQGMTWIAATDTREYSDAPMPEHELTAHRCDFSYVSHQSGRPESFRDEWREGFASNKTCVRLVDCIYEMLLQSLDGDPHIACANRDYLLERIEDEFGLAPPSDEIRQKLVHFYIYPLAEKMFRQCTLEWVADYCDRTGRTLHVYGNGWDVHPRFERYARGPAANGQQLRAIYQASRINLQIIGTGAVHQRLLDGLAAGGFFLLRYSPGDTMAGPAQRLLDAIRGSGFEPGRVYACDEIPEVTAAWKAYREHLGAPFVRKTLSLPEHWIGRLAELEAIADHQLAGAVFDRYGDVCFASREEFSALAHRYLAAPAERASVASAMRGVVVNRFAYTGLVDELVAFIGKRLSSADAG